MSLRGNYERPLWIVDPNAFRSSKNTLQDVFLSQIDMEKMDLFFLEGFHKVYLLWMAEVVDLNRCLPTLPFLPALTDLYFASSSGLNDETSLQLEDTQLPGLTQFWAYNCNLDEETADRLLLWILPSSAQTLKYLNIGSNKFTSIPSQLANFQILENIDVSFNRVNLDISSNSFFVSGNGIRTQISLYVSRVIHIESGAFQGIV